MVNVRKVLWWIYGLQAFFIFLVFSGGMARDEIPFWPSWNSATDVYIHLIFYSVFLVLPYVLLSAVYAKDTAGMEGCFFIISVWLLATICLFHEPIFDFVEAFFEGLFDTGAPAWYQWLHLLWLALTVVMVILWRAVSKAKMEAKTERRVREQLAAHEQWARQMPTSRSP